MPAEAGATSNPAASKAVISKARPFMSVPGVCAAYSFQDFCAWINDVAPAKFQ
jgi:hypothetical protein